jgi:hypothetical protein
MYDKSTLTTKINDDLPDNTSKSIDPDELREVLIFMLDRWFQDTEIKVTASGITATDLQSALEEILAASGAMTPGEIVTALEGLTGEDRLSYTSLKNTLTGPQIVTLLEALTGEDRLSGAKVDYDGTLSVTGIINQLVARLNLAYDSETTYKLGELCYNSGVIYYSIFNGHAGKTPASNPTYWSALTDAVALATIINSNATLSEMITANRIKFDETQTVEAKIRTLQAKLTRYRIQLEADAGNVTIGGEHDIFTFRLNRVPYEGIESDDFSGGAGAYDFRYQKGAGNTVIFLHPSLGLSFRENDIVDIYYHD